ncbi:MAG: hypothetical protein LBO09_05555 [Candidatus Peribacteria bacterium]|nr:hypothetical protein [Candidatus Peribacteria bacterium]
MKPGTTAPRSSTTPSHTFHRNEQTNTVNPKARMMYINDQIKAPSITIIDDEKQNL